MRVALCLVVLVAIAGCLNSPTTPTNAGVGATSTVPSFPTSPSTDGFVAWFDDLPSHVYSSFAFRQPQVGIARVERPWPGIQPYSTQYGTTVAPPGSDVDSRTREVCAAFDTGEKTCSNITLRRGEWFQFVPQWTQLPQGERVLSVLNATATTNIPPVPRLGERIESRYVVMSVGVEHVTNASWTYVIDVTFSNGTMPVELRFTPTGDIIPWSNAPVHLEIASTPTATRGPAEACAETILIQESRSTERGVLLWQDARVIGGCA